MHFGEKLVMLRKARGMTQEQLAAALSISRQAVSKWELGEAVPETENIVQLSPFAGEQPRAGSVPMPAGGSTGAKHAYACRKRAAHCGLDSCRFWRAGHAYAMGAFHDVSIH